MTATDMEHATTSRAREGVKEIAMDTAGEALQQTKDVASEARHHVVSMLDQTRGGLQQQSEQRTQQMSTSLRTLSTQLRSLREGRPAEAGPLNHYLIDAEQKVSTWAQRLESGGPQMVLQDMRSFARRKPGAFLAAAIGAGFLAGRLARVGAATAHDHDPPRSPSFDSSRLGASAMSDPGAGMADAPMAAGTFA